MKYFYIKLFLYNFTFLNERKLMKAALTIIFLLQTLFGSKRRLAETK